MGQPRLYTNSHCGHLQLYYIQDRLMSRAGILADNKIIVAKTIKNNNDGIFDFLEKIFTGLGKGFADGKRYPFKRHPKQ